MPQIQYSPTIPGVPYENAFHVLDDMGTKCGNAAVVEYVNHILLPERPLNFYISISAETERAFDLLMGAALARSIELRRKQPSLRARIYAPCSPYDTQLLRSFEEYGFRNDDSMMRMRKILTDTDRMHNPPVGCAIAPVVLETESDANALLARLNAYSVMARPLSWLGRLQQEQQLFLILGMWQDSRLLGELVLSAYGAEGKIEMLYTRPEFRRRGIGSALIAHAGVLLAESGIRSLTAEVWRRNIPAMYFFERADFESITPTLLYPGINL